MSNFYGTKKSSIPEKGQLDPDKIESEILASERTFLAWVRTNIAVMSLGFVIARFSVWMSEVSARMNPQIPVRRLGISAPLGECMIGLGALLTIFAAWRYHVVNRGDQARRNRGRSRDGGRCHSRHLSRRDRCDR
jgi:uncharacterized membrane protein YidH (DUF202 family)